MAMSSYVDFRMENPAFFQELKQIGISFSSDGGSCTLDSGVEYEFFNEDGDGIPYIGLGKNFMVGMFLEYFLGCGNPEFGYQFMKIMSLNGYFESNYNFEENPYNEDVYYDSDFYTQFHATDKLTRFDSTIVSAFVEGIEYDGEITAFRAVVNDGVMSVSSLQFDLELEWDDIDSLDAVLADILKECPEFTIQKTLQDGRWIKQ